MVAASTVYKLEYCLHTSYIDPYTKSPVLHQSVTGTLGLALKPQTCMLMRVIGVKSSGPH